MLSSGGLRSLSMRHGPPRGRRAATASPGRPSRGGMFLLSSRGRLTPRSVTLHAAALEQPRAARSAMMASRAQPLAVATRAALSRPAVGSPLTTRQAPLRKISPRPRHDPRRPTASRALPELAGTLMAACVPKPCTRATPAAPAGSSLLLLLRQVTIDPCLRSRHSQFLSPMLPSFIFNLWPQQILPHPSTVSKFPVHRARPLP
nr:unnamed protein product [Digitaria exilis]